MVKLIAETRGRLRHRYPRPPEPDRQGTPSVFVGSSHFSMQMNAKLSDNQTFLSPAIRGPTTLSHGAGTTIEIAGQGSDRTTLRLPTHQEMRYRLLPGHQTSLILTQEILARLFFLPLASLFIPLPANRGPRGTSCQRSDRPPRGRRHLHYGSQDLKTRPLLELKTIIRLRIPTSAHLHPIPGKLMPHKRFW